MFYRLKRKCVLIIKTFIAFDVKALWQVFIQLKAAFLRELGVTSTVHYFHILQKDVKLSATDAILNFRILY